MIATVIDSLARDKKGTLLDAKLLSFGWSALNSARTDLAIDHTSGHSYLVPFGDKMDGKEVTLAQHIIGRHGYVHACRRVGVIAFADAVHENDYLEGVPATSDKLMFPSDRRPRHDKPVSGERGPVVGAYAVTVQVIGSIPIVQTLYYNLIELNEIRHAKRGKESPAWKWRNGAAMYEKAPLIRLCKTGQYHHDTSYLGTRGSALQGGMTHAAHASLESLARRENLPMPDPHTDEDHELIEHMAKADEDIPLGTESTISAPFASDDETPADATDDDMAAQAAGPHKPASWDG